MISQNGKQKALINYYTSLVRKGSYTIEMVPEDIRDIVQNNVNELGPIKDPETQTPADDVFKMTKDMVGLENVE